MDKQLPEHSLLGDVLQQQTIQDSERWRNNRGVRSTLEPLDSFHAYLLVVGTLQFREQEKRCRAATHRELAPSYAAGKVPVPSGRECHWETRRPLPCSLQRSSRGVVVVGFGPLQQQSHAMSVCTPTKRGSLSPCPPSAMF